MAYFRYGQRTPQSMSTARAKAKYRAAKQGRGSSVVKRTRSSPLFTPKKRPAAAGLQTLLKKRRLAAKIKVYSGNSTSGGKFTSGSRSAAQNKAVYAIRGVSKTIEYGGVTQDPNAVYIGHATCPPNQMGNLVARALIKRFLIKIGKMPSETTGTIPLLTSLSEFTYWRRLDSALLPAPISIGSGPGVTFESLSAALETQLLTVPASGNEQIPVKLVYQDDAVNNINAIQMYIKNAKLHMYIKSSFKIQNRSTNTGDAEQTDVVDNVPLYGKQYEGNGTGTQYTGDISTVEIMADRIYGVIDKLAAADNSLREPPLGKTFPRVKKMGKAHLEPGQIKTSVLVFEKTMTLQTFCKQNWFGNPAIAANRYLALPGKYKFFCLEQMLKPFAASSDVIAAWEHNLDMNCFVVPGHETVTTRFFEQGFKP